MPTNIIQLSVVRVVSNSMVMVMLLCCITCLLATGQEPRRSDSALCPSRNDKNGSPLGDSKGTEESKKQEARNTVDEITSELRNAKEPDPYLYLDRGHGYMVLREYDKAFGDYSSVLKSRSAGGASYIALRYRVFASIGKADYAQALKDAKSLTRTSPPKSRAYAVCALILARSPDDKVKNPKAALDYALRASTMDDPGRDVSLVETALAAAHSANGDFARAVAHQEKAIAAVKAKIPSEMKAQLEAYRAEKEFPFVSMKPDR